QFVAGKMAAGEIPVPSHIQLAGFAEVTPAQEFLLNVMRQKDAKIENFPGPELRDSGSAIRIGFVDASDEIRTAARWARKNLESAAPSENAEPSIGIVVPELSKYRSVIERLFAEELHPNGRLSPD